MKTMLKQSAQSRLEVVRQRIQAAARFAHPTVNFGAPSELLLREKTRRGTIDVRSSWTRRGLRIWPLYFAFLVVAFAARSQFHIPLRQFVACLLFVGNFGFVLSAVPPSNLIGSLWSVSVEEQFYLTWPFFVRRLARPGIAKVACALTVISIAARAAVYGSVAPMFVG